MSDRVKISDREWRKQQRKRRFKNKKRDLRKNQQDKFGKKNRDRDTYEDNWQSS